MIFNKTSDESTSDGQNFFNYVVLAKENWRLILCIASCIFITSSLYAIFAQPIYRADALIQVEDSSGVGNEALGQLTSLFDIKQTAAAEVELIRSRLVVGQAVHALHLDIKVEPRRFPLIGGFVARHADSDVPRAAFLGLDHFGWGGEKVEVENFEVPREQVDIPFILRATAENQFEVLDGDGQVAMMGRVGQISRSKSGTQTIFVKRLIARPGTDFLITRSSTLNTIDNLQDDLGISEKTKQSGIIGVSLLGSDSERTAKIVNMIAATYVQQNVDRKSAEAEKTLGFLDQQLPVLRKQLDEAEDRYNAFRIKNGTVQLDDESHLLLQQIVDGKSKLADLEQQRVVATQRFTNSHPEIIALTAQIAALQSQQEQLNKRVGSLPNLEQSALRLLRDVKVDTELYTNLLNNAQQLRILKAGQVGSVRVVDFAVPQDLPVKPKRFLIVAVGLMLGLVAGLTVALLRKMIMGGLEESEEIEHILGLPIYASVPRSEVQARLSRAVTMPTRGQQHVLATVAPDDVAIEGLRSLRTALQIELNEIKSNVLVITGPRPSVGKSFVSVNLATVLASGGRRVLLIDADMRRGVIHDYFGVSRQPGLADLIGGCEFETALLRDVLPGLDVLPKGTFMSNPAELLLSKRFEDFVWDVSSKYDTVIFDTPPILAVTDAALLGRYAGTTLLVVRYGHHSTAELAESANRLRIGGVSLKGAVITDVPKFRASRGAYYSGHYGYQSISD